MANLLYQQALNQIEEQANKIGFGVFEANMEDGDERGEMHLIPTTKLGLAISPHTPTEKCLCGPKLMRSEPIKFYLHNPM